MNVSNLQVGQEYKNYKELCNVLGEKVKSSGKQYQLKDWERHFKFSKQGRKFIIEEIYDEPLPKEKRNHNAKYINLYKHLGSLCDYIVDDYGNTINELTIGSKVVLKWKCIECCKEYDSEVRRINKNGHTKCSECSSFNGERLLLSILKDLGVEYIKEIKFDGLTGDRGHVLRFDYGIIQDGKLLCIIDYKGQYSYYYEGKFKDDLIKDKYCDDNGIDLYKVHWDKYECLELVVCDIIKELNIDENVNSKCDEMINNFIRANTLIHVNQN